MVLKAKEGYVPKQIEEPLKDHCSWGMVRYFIPCYMLQVKVTARMTYRPNIPNEIGSTFFACPSFSPCPALLSRRDLGERYKRVMRLSCSR